MQHLSLLTYYDLREERARNALPVVHGRRLEMDRLSRIAHRTLAHNALIIGVPGIGKTSLVYGWIKRLCTQNEYADSRIIQLDTPQFAHASKEELRWYAQALAALPPGIVFLDDIQLVLQGVGAREFFRTFEHLLRSKDHRVIFCSEAKEFTQLEREHPSVLKLLEPVQLKEQSAKEYADILESLARELNKIHTLFISREVIEKTVSLIQRYPKLGQLPRAGVTLLDESIAHAVLLKKKELTERNVLQTVAERINVPLAQLSGGELGELRTLESILTERVVSQKEPLQKLASALKRAKLGLRNPDKPLGSFLLLGPSGVGKTETAKLVAELLFGRKESFARFDMSEFQQDHTVQRLLGAPAGYIGFEEGGALTNALRTEPHSLILLDEIEKAHPKVFDIFLQVLDDGRITSGQNESIDARNAIFMATSNIGVRKILDAHARGEDLSSEEFIQKEIMPELLATFRPEFINRFDAILVFNPLSEESLLAIAKLEIQKIEKRMQKHRITFKIEDNELLQKIKTLADPRFGARPVKRFIEETCESLVVEELLPS